jgi:hypothetical protein
MFGIEITPREILKTIPKHVATCVGERVLLPQTTNPKLLSKFNVELK